MVSRQPGGAAAHLRVRAGARRHGFGRSLYRRGPRFPDRGARCVEPAARFRRPGGAYAQGRASRHHRHLGRRGLRRDRRAGLEFRLRSDLARHAGRAGSDRKPVLRHLDQDADARPVSRNRRHRQRGRLAAERRRDRRRGADHHRLCRHRREGAFLGRGTAAGDPDPDQSARHPVQARFRQWPQRNLYRSRRFHPLRAQLSESADRRVPAGRAHSGLFRRAAATGRQLGRFQPVRPRHRGLSSRVSAARAGPADVAVPLARGAARSDRPGGGSWPANLPMPP